MIPARYGSSRFPGKPLAMLGGKALIVRTCEAAVNTGLFDEVYAVTDDKRIYDAVTVSGLKCLMSHREHPTGSDRIAEAVEGIECDIVVNIQGDVPFTSKAAIEKLLAPYYAADAENVDMTTLKQELTDEKEINDPNFVKVITDKNDYAIYFSRCPIPYPRNKNAARYFEHIGLYSFRRQALMDFASLPMLQNEAAESLECLRFIEYGKKIKVLETEYLGIQIDTPEDLVNANKYLESLK